MIQYLLNVECPNEECWNLNAPVKVWGPLESTNHPCGVCGHPVISEVVDQREIVVVESPMIPTPFDENTIVNT